MSAHSALHFAFTHLFVKPEVSHERESISDSFPPILVIYSIFFFAQH